MNMAEEKQLLAEYRALDLREQELKRQIELLREQKRQLGTKMFLAHSAHAVQPAQPAAAAH